MQEGAVILYSCTSYLTWCIKAYFTKDGCFRNYILVKVTSQEDSFNAGVWSVVTCGWMGPLSCCS